MKTALADALEIYLKLDRAPATHTSYHHTLSAFADAVGHRRNIRLISHADIIDYCETMRFSVKDSTYRQYVRVIITFFNWCVRTGLIEVNPATGIKMRRTYPTPSRERAIPQADIDAILEVAKACPRSYATIAFLADTGCRIGACTRLLIDDVDFEAYSARVIEKGSMPATVYFADRAAAALQQWLKVRPSVSHDYMWTSIYKPYGPIGKKAITNKLEEISLKAVGKSWNAHAFRHAAAVKFAESGVPAHITQRKLNQRSLKTLIENYYPNASEQQVAAWTRHLESGSTEAQEDGKIIYPDFFRK